MPKHIAATRQIEVGVIAEVDQRGFVRRRRVVNPQLIVVREGVGHVRSEVAGIAFFAVLAQISQPHASFVCRDRQRLTLLVTVGTLALTACLYVIVPKGFFPNRKPITTITRPMTCGMLGTTPSAR